ncbi:RNA 3'-terminal phosphate cyclase [Candidatus Borrarchaeum sp.]|uniref:RNA 3'-terminal phosphate cyclase n=1 Tax=Candidatus Borrarchaeum sp. TaxID=2846742 RepID=UPI00257EF88E|nr:RNA 3'-terminal phosphate cyclase [Candidatus Borrarchaeum sp.]
MTQGFVKIDGEILEGGGQILRIAAALSGITGIPVEIINIRGKRSTPGLKAQHLTGLKALADLTNASVRGLNIGSKEIEFLPTTRKGGYYTVDVRTAGSVTLLLQVLMPVAIFTSEQVNLKLIGGTTVRWSPPTPSIQNVLLPILKKTGIRTQIEIKKHGFYPKGGGIIEAKIDPSKKLKPIILDNIGKIENIGGTSYCAKLPEHVAIRQKKAAISEVKDAGYQNIEITAKQIMDSLSPGSGITLWAKTSAGAIIGSDAIGEKGKPAEVVGREAARKLLEIVNADSPVDPFLADQLIIYMALAEGSSKIITNKFTLHTKTAIEICKQLTSASFSVKEGSNRQVEITCNGIGFNNELL